MESTGSAELTETSKDFRQPSSKMSKEIVTKKRKATRAQITQLINAAEQQIAERAERTTLFSTQAQIKGLEARLKEANNQMEQYLTDEVADSEFERILQYDKKILAILSKLEISIVESIPSNINSPAIAPLPQCSARPDELEMVKLPNLELIKFDGNMLEWNRFWTQYKSSVHDRPNMSKAQKFNYLMLSLAGKAAAEIEGLKFCAEKNYDHAFQLLLEAYGRHEKSVDLHMNELLNLQKVKSIKDIEDL